jgi:hypothetical protein
MPRKIAAATSAIVFIMSLTFMRGLNMPRRIISNRFAGSMSRATALNSASTVVATEVASAVRHPAYEIVEQTVIEEYGCKATLYSHKKSGAQIMSVISPDENKVFGITFRTPPTDSTGIPHILEVKNILKNTVYVVISITISVIFLNLTFNYFDHVSLALSSLWLQKVSRQGAVR